VSHKKKKKKKYRTDDTAAVPVSVPAGCAETAQGMAHMAAVYRWVRAVESHLVRRGVTADVARELYSDPAVIDVLEASVLPVEAPPSPPRGDGPGAVALAGLAEEDAEVVGFFARAGTAMVADPPHVALRGASDPRPHTMDLDASLRVMDAFAATTTKAVAPVEASGAADKGQNPPSVASVDSPPIASTSSRVRPISGATVGVAVGASASRLRSSGARSSSSPEVVVPSSSRARVVSFRHRPTVAASSSPPRSATTRHAAAGTIPAPVILTSLSRYAAMPTDAQLRVAVRFLVARGKVTERVHPWKVTRNSALRRTAIYGPIATGVRKMIIRGPHTPAVVRTSDGCAGHGGGGGGSGGGGGGGGSDVVRIAQDGWAGDDEYDGDDNEDDDDDADFVEEGERSDDGDGRVARRRRVVVGAASVVDCDDDISRKIPTATGTRVVGEMNPGGKESIDTSGGVAIASDM
jgi:hypothetical protein